MATPVVDNEQQSDETFEYLCSPCNKKDRNTEAGKYCADCQDYYCTDCVKFHEEIPAMSGHKVIDKSEAETKSLPNAPTERCERHRFKLVDMFCKSHNDVGCYTCMAVDHRVCKDVFDIPEYVQNNDVLESIESTRKNLCKVEGSIKENIDACIREKEQLLRSKDDALHSLHAYRDEINKRLDELERNSIAAIEEEFKQLIGNVEEQIRVLRISQEEIKSAIDRFLSSGSNASQLFVSSIKGKHSVGDKRYSKDLSTRKKTIKVQFMKEEDLIVLLEKMNDIGKIVVPNELLVIGNKKQYNIRHNSDIGTCSISSACVLEDGSTILADKGNKKLKRLDQNYTVVDICDLPFEPWQMCLVDKDTVAVISWGQQTIAFITLGKEMTKSREITTDDNSFGIAFANGNIYVTNAHTSVFVYSSSGTKVKEFSKDQTGKALFKSLYGMAVSDNGSKIYVADNENGLVVLNMDGKLEGKYDCSELNGPRSVCLIENGSVLVSGESNNCILQFTSEGEKLGDVMSSDSEGSYCCPVCYDPRRYRLLVSRPDKNKIDIYDIL